MDRLSLRIPSIVRAERTLIVKSVAITVATILLFGQDLAIIFNDAIRSEITSHILAIPFLFIYLIYRRRKVLQAVSNLEPDSFEKNQHLPTIAGSLLSTTALLLYWVGSTTFTPLEYHLFALPIFIAGLVLILFNLQTLRQLAFPILFLLFLTPPPAEILFAVGSSLSTLSSQTANALANLLGVSSSLVIEYASPKILVVRPTGEMISFVVDIACSGIYSAIGFLIFGVFIAYIIRDKLWKKLAILILGLPLIYLLNILRITSILLIGFHYGEQLALQVFHMLGGWTLIFLGTLMLLVISEKILRTRVVGGEVKTHCPQCTENQEMHLKSICLFCGRIYRLPRNQLSKIDVTKIAVILTFAVVFLSIQEPVFAITQNAVNVLETPVGEPVSTEILPQISGYMLNFSYRDTGFEEVAHQDMALAYIYTPLPENDFQNRIYVTVEIAQSRSSLHRREFCLITWPISLGLSPQVEQLDLVDVELLDNPPIIGRYFAYRYRQEGLTEAVLYWFETSSFAVNETSQQRNVKISVYAHPSTIDDLPSIKDEIFLFGRGIALYRAEVDSWSIVAILLSQHAVNLIAVIGSSLIAVAAGYIYFDIGAMKRGSQAYDKLPKSSQQVVDAVIAAEQSGLSTLSRIAEAYDEATEQKVKADLLYEQLQAMEKTGIVRSTITSENDEPLQIWKPRM